MPSVIAMLLIVVFRVSCVAGFVILSEKLVDETKETEPDFQYYYGRYIFAREILQFLNIQEIK